MRKKSLQGCKMSTALVDDVAEKARWLVQRESRGPGDLEGAMRRLETRYGIPYGVLWSLRYRRPADIWGSALVAIYAAHDDMHGRQLAALRHEQAITDAKTRIGSYLARAAAAVAGSKGDLTT